MSDGLDLPDPQLPEETPEPEPEQGADPNRPTPEEWQQDIIDRGLDPADFPTKEDWEQNERDLAEDGDLESEPGNGKTDHPAPNGTPPGKPSTPGKAINGSGRGRSAGGGGKPNPYGSQRPPAGSGGGGGGSGRTPRRRGSGGRGGGGGWFNFHFHLPLANVRVGGGTTNVGSGNAGVVTGARRPAPRRRTGTTTRR